MIVKHLGSGIVLIEDLINKEKIDSFDFALIEKTVKKQDHYKVDDKFVSEGGYEILGQKDFDTTPIRYHQDIKELPFMNTITEAMQRGCLAYCNLFPVAVESITQRRGAHFIKYLKGGVMGPHSDSPLAYKENSVQPISLIALGNTITSSMILNDSFTGGSVYFPTWDISVTPKPGSALFYPSNYIGAHEIKEVTSGVRWAYLEFFGHGDRSLLVQPEHELYQERYEWTTKFKDALRENIRATQPFWAGNALENLNQCQREVLVD